MMVLLRLVFGLLLVAALVLLVIHAVTGALMWRQRALRLLRWATIAALVFFGVLILERLRPLL